MSRARAFISTLSFTLRVFLYLVLIGAVGYIGFGYTSGYVAVPSDTMLRLNPGKRDVVMFRKINCSAKTESDAPDTDDQSGTKPAPGAPAARAKATARLIDCDHAPMFALRNLALGTPGRIGVLVDGDASVNFRLDENAKSHLTIRKGDQSSDHEFEGKTVPADVLAKVPEKLRAPLARMVAGADDAGASRIVEQEFNFPVPPPGAKAPPPGAMPPPPEGAGAYQIGMLRGEDGTVVEYRRDIAKNESELTLRRGDQAKTHTFTGNTIPDAILNEIPETMRDEVKQMVSGGTAPPHFGKGVFIEKSELDGSSEAGARVLVQRLHPPGGPGTPGGNGDVLLFKTDGAVELPVVAGRAPVERVIELPGPALVQQQVLGHTGLRAALVGVTIALVFLAILQLERLLAHFQRGELFSIRNHSLMRNLGAVIVLIALVQAAGTMMPAILAKTLHPALIGAFGPHLLLVFAGFSLLLLSAVMAEAGRLEDEAEHTV